MKKTEKEAKFFCESCGSEVPRKSRFCPTCGKFFASVRCSKCGHTGASEDFKTGCPECGYAVSPDGKSLLNAKTNGFSTNNKKTASFFQKKHNNSQGNSDGSLPVWMYIISVLILIVLIICLYSCL